MQSKIKKVLEDISKRAILLNEIDISEEQSFAQWLGNPPASDEAIGKAEKTLQIKLPADYIGFLKICNGFPATHSTTVTFLPVEKIDFLINVDDFLVEVWNNSIPEIGEALSQSIIVGGFQEEQHFLLIPPGNTISEWRYWQFASWIPGQHEFKGLHSYFKDDLSLLRKYTKGLKKPKPKSAIDYSLRDYLFQHDWENALKTILRFFREGDIPSYCGDLFALLNLALLSVGKLSWQDKLPETFGHLYDLWLQDEEISALVRKAKQAWQAGVDHTPESTTEMLIPSDDPKSIADIEEQVREHVPHLLREKFAADKADYMLTFLYKAGNIDGFLEVYEANQHFVLLNSHLRAAEVYMVNNEVIKAQNALENHFQHFFDYNPLAPFLSKNLLPAMTKPFSLKIYEKMKLTG